jgi:cyclase
MRNICLLLICFFFVVSFVAAQTDFEKVQINTVKITDSLFMLKGAGGNIGASIGPDGILLIDTQFAPLYQKIKDTLHKLGGDKIKYVINTHWHGDHTSGNINFAKDAPIIAHKNVRETLLNPKSIMGRDIKPASGPMLPSITFDSEMTIYINGEDVKLIHMPPGHTDGDTVVYFSKADVWHVGDLFFNGGYPFIDLPNGGNVIGYAEDVKSLLERMDDGARIIPGHGELATKSDYEKFYKMLSGTIEFVKGELKKGKSLEEIEKEDLPKEYETWSKGFVNSKVWIDFIFNSLESKK